METILISDMGYWYVPKVIPVDHYASAASRETDDTDMVLLFHINAEYLFTFFNSGGIEARKLSSLKPKVL